MEPEVSLPCSQEPSTTPYPETDQSSPYHSNLRISLSSIFIVSSNLCLNIPRDLFLSGFRTKT
jgi:hypothetical protein